MENWLFGGLAVLLIGSIGTLIVLHQRQLRRRWADLQTRLDLHPIGAARFGLRYDLELAGAWRGVEVSYRLVTRGSGRGAVSYATVTARVAVPLPAGLEISREGILDQVEKTLGGQDLQLGGEIDRLLRVRADDRQTAALLLQDVGLRGALRRLLQAHRAARIVAGVVTIEERADGLYEVDELQKRLDRVRDVAAALANAADKAGLSPG